MATYNLLKEPWIPVVRTDGTETLMNLPEVLRDAHLLREVRDPLPIVEFGLYRLLTACVIDCFRLEGRNALARLLTAGHFPVDKLDAYFDTWQDRFDLFHPHYPFLQTAEMGAEKAEPLARLLPHIPAGINVTHFHHAGQEAFGVCPAAAARLLTTVAPFMTAGGPGMSPSVNGAPPWYVLVRGANLFETLCMNCPTPLPSGISTLGVPAWRAEEPVEARRYTEISLLQALTWQPRRIRLVPGESGQCTITGIETPMLVRTMKFTAGAMCDFTWRDPAVPYKITDKGPLVLRPLEGRELWRDTGPLALLREKEYHSERNVAYERPLLVTQADDCINRRALGSTERTLELLVYGMRTDLKMKVFEWQREQLSLSPALIRQGAQGGAAQQEMERAEQVEWGLKSAITHAYPRDGKSNTHAFEHRIADARQQFWAALRDDFTLLLQALAELPTGEEREEAHAACLATWRARVSDAGRQALEAAIDDLDTDGKALQRLVEARERFHRVAWVALHPEMIREKRARRQQTAPKGVTV